MSTLHEVVPQPLDPLTAPKEVLLEQGVLTSDARDDGSTVMPSFEDWQRQRNGDTSQVEPLVERQAEPEVIQKPTVPTVSRATAGRMGSLVAGQRRVKDKQIEQPVTTQAEPVQTEVVESEARSVAESDTQSSNGTWIKVGPTLREGTVSRRHRKYAEEIDALPIDKAVARLKSDQEAEGGDSPFGLADWYLEKADEAKKAAAALAAAESSAEAPSQPQEEEWKYDFEDKGSGAPQGRRVGDSNLDLASDIGTEEDEAERRREHSGFGADEDVFPQGIGTDHSTKDPMAGIRARREVLGAVVNAAQGQVGWEQYNDGDGQTPEPAAEPSFYEAEEAPDLSPNEPAVENGSDHGYGADREMTMRDFEDISALEGDDFARVYGDLTDEQHRQLEALRKEYNRGPISKFFKGRFEWIMAHPKQVKLAAFAMFATGVVTAIALKDTSMFGGHFPMPSGHSAGAVPTPTGTSTSNLASQTPTVGPSSSPSALASATPSPSGSPSNSGGNAFNDLLDPRRHHGGGNVAQPPAGGGNGAQSPIDRAIQASNQYTSQHPGHTQTLWESLHEGGYTDTQIANALDNAEKANALTQHAADGGGYFVRLTNGSDNPVAIMQMLKTQGFLS